MDSTRNDRTVHAICEDGREIVRYERAGKWYVEPIGYPDAAKRRPVSLAEAVTIAAEAHVGRGQILYGQSGGLAFDRRARSRVDELYRERNTRRSA